MKKFCLFLLLLPLGSLGQEPVGTNGRYTKVDGIKLYYEDWGKGDKTLVLLHSFSATASQWRPFIPEWLAQYRVIAVDLPGHGRSEPMDTSDIFLHRQAAHLMQNLLAGLGISTYSVMGASSGGIIALYMASGHPERVEKLVVIGGQLRYSATAREVIVNAGPDYLNPDYMRRATEKHGARKAYQLGRQSWRFRILEGDPDITAVMLAGIQARTLIVHGDNDPVAPVSNALDMFRHIPGSSLWVIPDGKHLPHLNKRFQPEFFRTMGEFLYSE